MVKALGNRFLLYICLSCIAIPSVTQKRQEKAEQMHAATNSDICEPPVGNADTACGFGD